MYITLSFFSSFLISLAFGRILSTFKELSFITVTVIKKNKSINTISGNEAVDTAGVSPSFFFANFDIVFYLCFVNYQKFLPQIIFEEIIPEYVSLFPSTLPLLHQRFLDSSTQLPYPQSFSYTDALPLYFLAHCKRLPIHFEQLCKCYTEFLGRSSRK